MKKVAIISPSITNETETFIESHKQINHQVVFYYGDFVPRYLAGKGLISIDKGIINRPLTLIKMILSFNFYSYHNSGLSIFEYLFAKSLKHEKIDVVLAEYGTTGACITNACKWAGIPLITHFHGRDASAKEVIEEYKKKYIDCFNFSHKIVGVSRSMCTKLEKLGCPKEKLVYCPCAPNEQFYKVVPYFSKKQFFFVGRFVEKKAPYITIFAFAKVLKSFPDIKLLMGGEGPLLGCCRSLVKMLGIERNVEFTGQISQDEIRKMLSESIAYVQHSVTADDGDMEGTPVAIMEASAAGLPVIATRHAGIPDVIIDNETGLLCDEYDTDKMAEYMCYLIENNDAAKTMGAKGKDRMKRLFSKDKQLRILTEIINSTTI